jgi:hypothetical protein
LLKQPSTCLRQRERESKTTPLERFEAKRLKEAERSNGGL